MRRVLSSGEPAAARLDKLEAMIARSGLDAKDIAPFLAALLSIPVEGRYPPLEMAPSEQKERTIAALIALFEGLTKDAPVLALLEDAHWIDPTSLDVFGRLVDRLPSSARAAGRSPSGPNSPRPGSAARMWRSLQLNRFGRRQALAMVDRVAGGKALPAEVLERDRRQDRRRAAVRGGTDQDGAGVRPAARGERGLCPRPRR